MKTKPEVKGPAEEQVDAALGPVREIWNGIIEEIARKFQPLDREWKTSKTTFGWVHLLKHKKRTLLYMLPEQGQFLAAVVLGERAVGIALNSSLPDEIKKLIAEARPYAEGRGIRFPVNSPADIKTVSNLVDIKTTPK